MVSAGDLGVKGALPAVQITEGRSTPTKKEKKVRHIQALIALRNVVLLLADIVGSGGGGGGRLSGVRGSGHVFAG